MFKVINCCYDLYFTYRKNEKSKYQSYNYYSEGWVSEFRFRRIHYLILVARYFDISQLFVAVVVFVLFCYKMKALSATVLLHAATK